MKRIGIFSGSFDPVHEGHVRFALQVLKSAKLDEIYFLPETNPRRKTNVTDIFYRSAMIELASSEYSGLNNLELPDQQFSVEKSLPKLKQLFPGDELFLIVGSDVIEFMPKWPRVEQLLKRVGLIIAIRGDTSLKMVKSLTNTLPLKPKELHIIKSPMPLVASRQIRVAVAKEQLPVGLMPNVQEYIAKNQIYSSTSSSFGSRS